MFTDWGHTFAHRVGYHTRSVERPGQGVSFMREKRKQTKKADSNHSSKQSKGLPGLTLLKKKLGRQHCKAWIGDKGQAEEKMCFCSTIGGNLNYQNSATVTEELNLFPERTLSGPQSRYCSWNVKMVQHSFGFIHLYMNPSKLSQRASARWPAWDKAGKIVTVLEILWLWNSLSTAPVWASETSSCPKGHEWVHERLQAICPLRRATAEKKHTLGPNRISFMKGWQKQSEKKYSSWLLLLLWQHCTEALPKVG